jgi:hypothetical protein
MQYNKIKFIKIFTLSIIVLFFSCADKNNSELSAAKKDADANMKNSALNESV